MTAIRKNGEIKVEEGKKCCFFSSSSSPFVAIKYRENTRGRKERILELLFMERKEKFKRGSIKDGKRMTHTEQEKMRMELIFLELFY